MGKRGPKPLPTAIHAMRDSWRAKINPAEPVMDPAAPACPDWLDARAKEYWAAIAPILSDAKVLTKADGNALARYCQLLARWRKCEEFIARHGDTFPLKNEAGDVVGVKEFPQVRRASDLNKQLCGLEDRYGLNPSARSRITTVDGGQRKEKKPEGKSRFFGPRLAAG